MTHTNTPLSELNKAVEKASDNMNELYFLMMVTTAPSKVQELRAQHSRAQTKLHKLQAVRATIADNLELATV